MSNSNDEPSKAQGPGKEQTYKVGHKKPPLDSRFTKGHSGNPSGRPKGRTAFSDILLKEFHKSVLAIKNGKPVKITNGEIFAAQLVKAGITKGPQSSALLLNFVLQQEASKAAEAAKHEAKKAVEPEKPFSWTEEQKKLYRELEDEEQKMFGSDPGEPSQ